MAKSPYADQIADMEINMTLGMFGEPVAMNLVLAQVVQKMLQDNLGLNNVVIHQEPMADYLKPTYATHLWTNSQGEHTMDVYSYMNNLIRSRAAARRRSADDHADAALRARTG